MPLPLKPLECTNRPMNIQQTAFGKTADGQSVDQFTLTSSHGVTVKLCSYGATVTEVHAPDKSGKTADVVLGFDSLAPYLGNHPYLGCMVGRVANRIAAASFTLNGKTYKLNANNGPHSLHGGPTGMARRVWAARIIREGEQDAVEFSYRSPDMEEGFPGNMNVRAVYSLRDKGTLRIDMYAVADQPTPVNLTNHSYFNLNGAGNGDILKHELFLAADFYTPVDDHLITTGEIRRVIGGPLDFTKPAAIGSRIGQVPGGYDHNFVLRGVSPAMCLAARVVEPVGGRMLEVHTTQPGVQLYTGNFLDESAKGIGGAYGKHGGFCLETQHFPNAINHGHFPGVLLHPGQTYHHVVEYRFLTV